ncbi:MAG TPA: hypothetical protein VFD85_14985 [Gemmatimonadales bacterium]|nr:hypothetical protein [Gemmatimonadales bacterium]
MPIPLRDVPWWWPVVGALVLGYGYLRGRRAQRLLPPPPPLTPEERVIVEEFQLRERRANRLGWPVAAVACAIMVVAMTSASLVGYLFAAVTMFCGAKIITSARCPACNKLPRASLGGGNWGVMINATTCPNCGARLA